MCIMAVNSNVQIEYTRAGECVFVCHVCHVCHVMCIRSCVSYDMAHSECLYQLLMSNMNESSPI